MYPERDSNAHCPGPEPGASCRWATRACVAACRRPVSIRVPSGYEPDALPLSYVGEERATTRTRTGCLRLRRTSLCQVSYGGKVWSRRPGSNRPARAYKARALPTELRRHGALDAIRTRTVQALDLVPPAVGLRGHRAGSGGLEPPTFRVRTGCAARLHQLPSRPAG